MPQIKVIFKQRRDAIEVRRLLTRHNLEAHLI